METAPPQPRRDSATGPAAVLFLCMFASQAGLLVLGPTLPQVAADLGVSMATAGQLRAIQEWVREGGTFVVTQPAEYDKTLPLAEMLPVTVSGVADREDLGPLPALARATLAIPTTLTL